MHIFRKFLFTSKFTSKNKAVTLREVWFSDVRDFFQQPAQVKVACRRLSQARPWLPQHHLESRNDLSLPVRQARHDLSCLGPVQDATGSQAFANACPAKLGQPPPPGQALANLEVPASEAGHWPGLLGRERLIRMLKPPDRLGVPQGLALPLDSEHKRQGRAGQWGAGRHGRWQRLAVCRPCGDGVGSVTGPGDMA